MIQPGETIILRRLPSVDAWYIGGIFAKPEYALKEADRWSVHGQIVATVVEHRE